VLGRDEELARLEGILSRAARGEGRVLLIEGEAGIGKTRLVDEFVARAGELLDDVQSTLFDEAAARMRDNVRSDVTDFEAFAEHFGKRAEKTAAFVAAKWCEDEDCEQQLKPLAVSIRCLPLEQSGTSGSCVLCARPASRDAIFARAY